jgi:hypothetical protein
MRSILRLYDDADMAEATIAAIDRWPSRRALIVADDRPSTWREVLDHAAVIVGGAAPAPGGRAGLPSFRMRNQRIRDMLSWRPVYTDFRVGLAR